MKQKLHIGSLILLLTLFLAFACKKSVDQPAPDTGGNIQQDTTLAAPGIPYPVTPSPECSSAPDYGDSVVYSQPSSSGGYTVYPQNNQGVQGTYLSWPEGLDMDAKTGAVNLTSSETGQRYEVAFVRNGTTDTCLSQLIVAGAAYMDSVYVLSQSDTTSRPYFNANPNAPSPCQGSSGPGSGCQFDYNDFAQKQGIVVDKKTGFIDLKRTMKNRLFGMLPLNGTTVYTTINYKLNDNSNNAAQKIQLKMMYYNRKSDIPADILANVTNNLNNTLQNLLISKGPSTRPPLIIIVRNN